MHNVASAWLQGSHATLFEEAGATVCRLAPSSVAGRQAVTVRRGFVSEPGITNMARPSDLQLPPPTDWQKFERWMADLFQAEWKSPATLHGRTGQPQHGVDVFGRPNGGDDVHGVQCKRKEMFADDTITVEELVEEVEKAKSFEPALSHFILAVAGRRDGKVQRAAEKLTLENRAVGGFSVQVMFWEDVQRLYDRHRDVIEEHYRELFERLAARPIQPLHQLPAAAADFTGRSDELREMLAAVGEGGLTISGLRGMGGVGKTALALVVAHELAAQYDEAQIFLDLMGTSATPLTAARAMAHVIHAFEPEARLPDDEAHLAPLYRSVLHGKRALLLMDNAAGPEQVAPLIPPPGCLLVVTSRAHFTLPGLRTWNLDALPEADAEELLKRICPRIGDAAAELAALCGRLPLALRMAASSLVERPNLAVEEFVHRLGKARGRLNLVEASLAMSYDLLAADLKRRWRVVGVFPADFDAAAAAAVWEIPMETAHESLAELLRRSLLEFDEATQQYRLHDLLRDLARDRTGREESEVAARRHARHYLTVLREAESSYKLGGEAIRKGLDLFDRERTNIEAGRAWAVARAEDDPEADRLCTDYPDWGTYVLHVRLPPRQQITWRTAALAAAKRLKDRLAEGRHLGNRGLAHHDMGEYRQAIEFYEEFLAITREIGDRHYEGLMLGNLGDAWGCLGEYRRAIQFLEEALKIDREIGNRRYEGTALEALGNAYVSLGKHRRAIECHEKSLAIARDTGDRFREGAALYSMARALWKTGKRPAAVACAEAALRIKEVMDDRWSDDVRRMLARWRKEMA